MSQDYFDSYVNLVGEKANKLAKVVNPNKITSEEINSWSDILD